MTVLNWILLINDLAHFHLDNSPKHISSRPIPPRPIVLCFPLYI